MRRIHSNQRKTWGGLLSLFLLLQGRAADEQSSGWLEVSSPMVAAFSPPVYQTSTTRPYRRTHTTHIFQSRDWIDEVSERELLDAENADGGDPILPFKPDMRYLPRNVLRQSQNFVAIRQAGGVGLTRDVYVRAVRTGDHSQDSDSDDFWFVGKLARVSDVTPTHAVLRQYNIIATHAANLRPMELFPYWRKTRQTTTSSGSDDTDNKNIIDTGGLELWLAPGDSEMDVAYHRPHVVFEKVDIAGAQHNDNALMHNTVNPLKSNTMGFQGEMYEGGEPGFRAQRRIADGKTARPEIKGPNDQGDNDAPATTTENMTDEQLQQVQQMLQGMDINEVYKEQQRRAGIPVEDDDDF